MCYSRRILEIVLNEVHLKKLKDPKKIQKLQEQVSLDHTMLDDLESTTYSAVIILARTFRFPNDNDSCTFGIESRFNDDGRKLYDTFSEASINTYDLKEILINNRKRVTARLDFILPTSIQHFAPFLLILFTSIRNFDVAANFNSKQLSKIWRLQ